jgi:hypothetical protein
VEAYDDADEIVCSKETADTNDGRTMEKRVASEKTKKRRGRGVKNEKI